MLVRASVHTAGLRPGETADLNGNDPAVRAALAAGYLERVSDEPGPTAAEEKPAQDPDDDSEDDDTEDD